MYLACGTCPAPAMAGLPPTLLALESTGTPEDDEPYPVMCNTRQKKTQVAWVKNKKTREEKTEKKGTPYMRACV